MLQNKQSRSHSFMQRDVMRVVFAYQIMVNTLTRKRVPYILQNKFHCEFKLSSNAIKKIFDKILFHEHFSRNSFLLDHIERLN